MGLKDKLVTLDNFDKDEIILDDLKDGTTQRIYLFYKSLDKIWIMTPKLKVIYMPTVKHGDNTLTVAFCITKGDSKQFYKLITKIDRAVKTRYGIDFKPSITKHNDSLYKMYLSVPLDKERKCPKINAYNNYSEKIEITDITHLSTIAAYIELNYVWYDGDKIGIQWDMLQIKYYHDTCFDECQFDDGEIKPRQHNSIEPQSFTVSKSKAPPPPPPPPPGNRAPNISAPSIQKESDVARFIPTASELADMKKKLKKTR